MAILIDTSVLIGAERTGVWLDRTEANDDHAISVVTASELLHGVHRAASEATQVRRRAFVEHVLANFDPLPITMPVARAHAEIWASLDAAGTPIGTHDLWIAATALAHGLSVATTNVRHFERVPGLEIVAA